MSEQRQLRLDLVYARDADADGAFVYAVKTTGVYCHPSCPSRPAKPENIEIYDSAADAERAGFRACRRCRADEAPPRQRRAALIVRLCREIERRPEPPSLSELAELAERSPDWVRRTFVELTGNTPKQYATACRAERVRAELRARRNVTDALYEAGYNSSSRFYEKSTEVLGMTPTSFRNKGRAQTIRFAVGQCSLGAILIAATDLGVCAIYLGDQPEPLVHDLESQFAEAELIGADSEFEELVARVVGLIDQPNQPWDLPLDIQGTAFQQQVWTALTKIPSGTTVSYGELAQAIGRPKSVRAVAGACAANKIAVAIPCHRVVRADGSLSGYRWGVERKAALMASERRCGGGVAEGA